MSGNILLVNYRTFVALLVLLWLGSATAATSDKVAIPLTGQDFQLIGWGAERKLLVRIDAPKDRLTEPVLAISWRRSALVDSGTSTLAVDVDGVARFSTRLNNDLQGEFLVPLPRITGGTHSLRLRASLRSRDDDCTQRHRDDTWLTIEAKSSVSWQRRVSAQTAVSVGAFPAHWARLADGDTGIVLDYQAELDQAGVGAFFDADHLLRRWGYLPYDRQNDRTVGKLLLATMRNLPPNHPAVRRLQEFADARFAFSTSPNSTLEVVGRDTTALREALLTLADDAGRNRCEGGLCTSPSQRALPTVRTTPRKLDANAPALLLAQAGYDQGWLAQGEGRHSVRFVWRRPAAWTVREWPMLRIAATASRAGALDAQRSALSVRINDRPVASYPLNEWRNGAAEVRIPRDLWAAPEWVFELSATLLFADAKACAGSNSDTAWVHVGSDTALLVPHDSVKYDGIAQFFADGRAHGPPGLLVDKPELRSLRTAASALYPFIRQEVSANSAIAAWEIASREACAKRSCIHLRNAPPQDAALQRVGDVWSDRSGLLRLPHVSQEDSLALFFLPASKQPAQLALVPGPPSAQREPIDPPDYAGLLGRIALFSKRWHILDVRAPGASDRIVPAQDEALNVSAEQRKLRWINLVWGTLAVIAIAALLLRLWRRPRSMKPDEHWETHR